MRRGGPAVSVATLQARVFARCAVHTQRRCRAGRGLNEMKKLQEVDWVAVRKDGFNIFTKLIRTKDPREAECAQEVPVPGKQKLAFRIGAFFDYADYGMGRFERQRHIKAAHILKIIVTKKYVAKDVREIRIHAQLSTTGKRLAPIGKRHSRIDKVEQQSHIFSAFASRRSRKIRTEINKSVSNISAKNVSTAFPLRSTPLCDTDVKVNTK
ncbi:hypothetical protein EVAR_73135_1 [Eumeta japonica]|uniref:Uncharacterized protein n=1 Tax=Eumeta variegata TaxID=151549 RepID=A0A4C1SYV7_EUMVA|nr:hypothetical protein EVAR_73135_1 [Eumeta japonica]